MHSPQVENVTEGNTAPMEEPRRKRGRPPKAQPSADQAKPPRKMHSPQVESVSEGTTAPMEEPRRKRVKSRSKISKQGATVEDKAGGALRKRERSESEKDSEETIPTPEVSQTAPRKVKEVKNIVTSQVQSFVLSAGNRRSILDKLARKTVQAVKKTGHNRYKKPYTIVTEGCPSLAYAKALLGEQDSQQSSSSKTRLTKWFIGPQEIRTWLPSLPENIFPVPFDGKQWILPGQEYDKRFWQTTAEFESLQVTFVAADSLLTLKFRTYMEC
ncbi:hypothetical protein CYMTET_51242 [Cymbomonas tetramitiformis]|uniref:Uncharacterized protein n=1 Tax=Cymbomonas tetramitiformis TaxID=36881 RepID=A0AAE0ESV1_9CHLO|nr:hypothetical protein CYMTET_51242 [Cymbomonas tetramitiformis]